MRRGVGDATFWSRNLLPAERRQVTPAGRVPQWMTVHVGG